MKQRELVLRILMSVMEGEAYSHLALKQVLDAHPELQKQERGFITRVCEGTLERMLWIDHVLNQVSDTPVRKMKPIIRTILRSGVYELAFMDSVPVSATVNEAVKLTAKRGFGNLKGFVNAVLRGAYRRLEAKDIAMPDRRTEPMKWLSLTYSMPEWIIRQWQGVYTEPQIEEMLQAFLRPQPTSIRVNTLKTTQEALRSTLLGEGLTVAYNEEVPDALFISGYDSLGRLDSFANGLFHVQDASSQRVALLAEVKPGDLVIDVCAAPGGKSLHAAQLLQGGGQVEARDLTPYKVGLIEENIERLGLSNIRAVQLDAGSFRPEDKERADIVLADLPCSGLGVIGRKGDLKYRMTATQQQELVQLQRKILRTSQAIVKPGGVLLYSTCTIHKGENEENTAWFLQEYPEYTLEHEEQILPGREPHDGFYISKMRKRFY